MVRAREVLAHDREQLEALVAERTAELMASEETLRHSLKMEAMGRLTGGIAHDFNNMLQGIASGLEMGQRRVKEGRVTEAAQFFGIAYQAMQHAAGLTRRLLAFARRQRLEPKVVDVDALITGLADLVRRTVGPGIAVALRMGGGGATVLCDPNELESALVNLCINARDAMPEGGRLTLATRATHLSATDMRGEGAHPGPYLTISVTDTGTGMSPDVVDHAFEPFFTTKPQGEGTGLGLSQVFGFVQQSGGLVRMESVLGRGTTVHLFLPRHEATAMQAATANPYIPPLTSSNATVLLVDDEDAVRGPAAERLREQGLIVLEARDGPEALRILAVTRADLLVTDVGLPNGMNGRTLAEGARQLQPRLPVLFITGYAAVALPPGIEVIGKPFELDELVRRVQTALETERRNSGVRSET